jgi:hypothetical protein
MATHPVHRIFISYHHANDQQYKAILLNINERLGVFADYSVDTGNIDPNLPPQTIRCKIRDEYLGDSSVTVLLVGTGTAGRKHVDWETYSSMINGSVNKKSGIVVVQLPSTNPQCFNAAHGEVEKKQLYPETQSWYSVETRSEYERLYPYLPARIIDQLLAGKAKVSVTQWRRLGRNLENLAFLIDCAYRARVTCEYDLSRPMKMRDS